MILSSEKEAMAKWAKDYLTRDLRKIQKKYEYEVNAIIFLFIIAILVFTYIFVF